MVRRVEEYDELVYLQERPCGLRDPDLELGVAGGVVFAHLVLDGLGEELPEQAHHHLDRAR
ncbi:MAG TPA: hypothetical protein VFC30_01255 [Solirubrobacteraceae bacterium]|nr:hypothetical protein [Solirubrobacteraceae bacterium]